MSFELDHVAVESSNIPASIAWYTETCGAEVLYQDATWALLQIGVGKLALVTPSQHSQHIGVRVGSEDLERASTQYGKKIDSHRDGTRGLYIEDPDGNTIEFIHYPE